MFIFITRVCTEMINIFFLFLFEGVCVNYRHPGPRRGEPRVGSAPHVAFPRDPVDPLDPLQNSVRPQNERQYNDFGTFCRNWGAVFDPNLKKIEKNQALEARTLTQKYHPQKSRFLMKIFDNFVFLISSRAQTSLVHTNSTRRIFLDRSQGFLTSFVGVIWT